MNELDKMMACLGFNETAVKNYGNAIPFSSKKLEIMKQINQASLEKARNSDLFALFYILSIAFSVMVMRFIVFAQTGDVTIMTVFTSIVIRYSEVLKNSLTAMSFLISIVICVGTGVMINYLKNESHFC
ncbi:hypothetical protein LNN31_06505 [Acetobacterium wieringae]|uniref:Uncharacterized protein n=1 Tax=Acetobacterium wieringae TaxID=52694 RepID=A0A1F2PHV6_9FIRM|nr:hypothetical protein [Acetobacterium wieringae]MEA4807007.1 hypothetical protein [Acetobacterium wieringae]OFV70524.1 hypothetical protein ACWI_20030 [Acetobacterium wieringae]TYC84712.1 hypothetical protein FXB42_10245 [Acetobacterium wieringae]URN85592.1 hypothetical protein CHL1_001256 [Acetobacterium wieringae]UYO64061.1 hypothetical protein LNN31_06505 [Acetobacterium wieringae]